jgi:hypothetical protein
MRNGENPPHSVSGDATALGFMQADYMKDPHFPWLVFFRDFNLNEFQF